MKSTLINKIKKAVEQDPKIICDRADIGDTFGNNPDYLLDVFGITKSDLIRLEREGYAMKARYEVEKTKEHRVRWVIFKEVCDAISK